MCYSCNAADVPSNIFYYQSLLGDAYRIYTHILKYTGICSGLLTNLTYINLRNICLGLIVLGIQFKICFN